jgi:competence protein ComEA
MSTIRQILVALVLALAFAGPAFAAGAVDINHADAKALAEGLEGVGLSKAEAIVAYREQHGPFRSVEQLDKVKGIGKKTVERNRDNIVLGDAPAKVAATAAADASAS